MYLRTSSIVVSPAERRLGLGKKFLDLWMETLRAANAPGYIVFTDNLEGIRFYEKYKGTYLTDDWMPEEMRKKVRAIRKKDNKGQQENNGPTKH